jgi:hypothetical protein
MKKLESLTTHRLFTSILVSAGIISACASNQDSAPLPLLVVTNIESPAASPSGESNLTIGADGFTYMSWIEGDPESGFELRMSKREAGAWSAGRTVATGSDWFVNWADFPALAISENGAILNSWLQKTSSETFSYDIKLALSQNITTDWGESFTPHTDGIKTEHGFVSLLPLKNNSFAAIWLDGRQFTEQGPMSLRYCEIDSDGEISAETALDLRVCDCCQTALTQSASGALIAAYRDRSDSEIRDISFVRFAEGKWSTPTTVFDDNWYTPACPVNGPALAASSKNIAIAWFTRDSAGAYVRLAFSEDDGISFKQPLRIDNGSPEGRVDVAFLDEETALVSWLEIEDESAALYLRSVTSARRIGNVTRVTNTSAARASGFAHLAVNTDETLISWTDTKEPAQVRVALVTVQK